MVNGVQMISCFIGVSDNNFSSLTALGVQIEKEFDKLCTALCPVDKIEAVAELRNVTLIEVSEKLEVENDRQRAVTQAYDAITNSSAAQALGITNAYTGKGVILGIIDSGIDFQHIAFKDSSGKTRIKRAYKLSGSNSTSLTTYSTESQINALTYDTNSGDHGTHTSTTAGGSSVIVNGSTVTVTDDHEKATYGGMAPEADLVIAGLSSLYTASIATAIGNICDYADSQNKPCVISLSLGSQVGAHDGTGTVASVVNQYAGNNHIIVYAASNDGMRADAFVEMGTSNGGGMYASGTSTSSKPMIVNVQRSFSNADGNVEMLQPTICAYARTAGVATSLKFHVVNVKTGAVVYSSSAYTSSTTIDVTGSSGLAQYFKSSSSYSNAYGDAGKIRIVRSQDTANNKYYWMIYAPIMLSTSYAANSSGVYESDYAFCVSVYPTSTTASTTIDMWENSYCWFGQDLNLSSSSYNYCKGNDECSVSDNACYEKVISVGAYVTRNSVTNYAGTVTDASDSYPNIGDHAYFSSWQTQGYGVTGAALPTINAPGARIVAGVNHYHTTSVDDYSYYGDDYSSDLVVNSTSYPYAAMEGTSMATPCVSGIIAQWLQACVEKGITPTPDYIKEVMAATWDTDEWTNGTGSGAHGAKTFGTHGKINAISGLQYILGVSGGPTIKATPTEVAFDATYVGESATKDITVTGVNLEGNITASVSGTAFSINKTSISKDSDGKASATITVTFSPTAATDYTGTITLKSTNADNVTVSLSGAGKEKVPTIAATETLTFENTVKESTTQTIEILSEFLEQDITVSLTDDNGVFTLGKTSIAKADAEENTIDVTFRATKAGTYSGTVTLTSGTATATVKLTATANPKQTSYTIYQLTNTLTSGGEYLVVSRNSAGAGYALGHSGTTVTSDAVTVKAADDISSSVYISSDDVDGTSVWTIGASGNLYTFKNGSYYVATSGSGGSRALAMSTSSTNWTWNGTSNYLYYAGKNSYYIRYSSGFSINSTASSIYLYKKTTVTVADDEPTITATPTSYDFGTVQKGSTNTATITVTGENLEANITATVSGTGFSISPSTIKQTDGDASGTITVTFNPTTTGTFSGTLTLSSDGATATVSLTGKAIEPELIADPETLTFSCEATRTDEQTFDVLGANLIGNVTATLTDPNGVFSLSQTTISKADAEAGKTITVTFSPSAEGSYSGTVTLSSDNAESVSVTLNATATKFTPDSWDVTVGTYGVTTLYLDFPVTIPYSTYPDLLGVYYVYSIDDGEARLARLRTTIPANTGVVVQGNSGTYTFPKATGEVTPLAYTNYLTGTVEDITTSEALDKAGITDGIVLTLGLGSNGYIGFYRYSGTTLFANKAFFVFDSSTGSTISQLNFNTGGQATGIDSVDEPTSGQVDKSVYTLDGRKINGSTLPKGVYIQNGKKVIIK